MVIHTDFNKIKSIEFKVPEMMSDKAKDYVLKLFEDIKHTKDRIIDLRMEANHLEDHLKCLEDRWNCISSLLNIEYEKEEVKDVKNTSNVGFNFSADINKHIH